MKERKIVYCKYCGGELDENRKCTKCGKQFLNIKLKTCFTYLLLMIVGFLAYKNYYLTQKCNNLEEINYFMKLDYDEVSQQYEELSNEVEKYSSALKLLETHSAVTVPSDIKHYHTFDCSSVQNEPVINVGTIIGYIAHGYEPCPLCHKK